MDQTAHCLAAKSRAQVVQFLNQGSEDRGWFQQVHRDKMVRHQDLAQLQIVFDTISEQSAWKRPAFAPRHDDAALARPPRARQLPRKPQPSGQVECRYRLAHQRID
jgi:hypothetical protein